MTKTIPLTRGYFTVVDDEDYESLSRYSWCSLIASNGAVYARRNINIWTNGVHTNKGVQMHRQIMGLSKLDKLLVDHKDGDTLNNRRSNLRLATNSQNRMNSRLAKNNTSGYKGVSFHKGRGKWSASIRLNKKSRHIGLYSTPELAARAYDEEALNLFGPFAYFNFSSDQAGIQ